MVQTAASTHPILKNTAPKLGFLFLLSFSNIPTHAQSSLTSWSPFPSPCRWQPFGAVDGMKPLCSHSAWPSSAPSHQLPCSERSLRNQKISTFLSTFIVPSYPPLSTPSTQQPGIPWTSEAKLWRQSRTKNRNVQVTFKGQQLSLRISCPLGAHFIICSARECI